MKKSIILLTIAMISVISYSSLAQKTRIEVLYFKANLSCCKARSCNALEADMQKIISDNFKDSSVVFKEIKLLDEANKALIDRYRAQSQTVIIVKKKKKKETFIDVSDVAQAYVQSQNKETLKQQLIAKINELKKK